MLDRDSHIPLYKQLSNIIKEQISSGKLKSGSKISSVNELMREYRISRVTVVLALEDLVKQGLIISIQGKGSYVRTSKLTEQLSVLRSFQEVTNLGESNVTQKVLSFKFMSVDDTLSAIFSTDEQVLKIGRLHIQENTPIAYVNIYLLQEIADTVTREEIERYSMFEILEKNNVQVTEAIQKIGAEPANKYIADILQVEQGFPLVVNERTSYDQGKKVIMYSEFYYRYDAYSFIAKLHRTPKIG